MKILVLCKRQYTNKDLLDDEYGRLFEIPETLATYGHEVKGITLSYRRKASGQFKPKKVEWHSINAIPFSPTDAIKHIAYIRNIINTFKPDFVWASSDAWHIIAAEVACTAAEIPFIADFYDNYESFALTRAPFVTGALKKACRKAHGITVVTGALKNYLLTNYKLNRVPVEVIGNGINQNIFYPRNKYDAQKLLKLPTKSLFIGTAGTLDASRGIQTLLDAFTILAGKIPDLYLIVAGPRDNLLKKYTHSRLIDLGNLPQQLIPLLFSSLDVAVICNVPSAFGSYCYPQKFAEIQACGTPMVCANVGEMPILMLNDAENLFDPYDPQDLSNKIYKILTSPAQTHSKEPPTWNLRANTLMEFMVKTNK